jgi:hypothetical protein
MPANVGTHAMRRGDARHEMSARVSLKAESGGILEGWALNVSRGGVRVIMEEKVELGAEYEVTIGDPEEGTTRYCGRIVWLQEELDGVIAGIEFLGISGAVASVPPPPDSSVDDETQET